jgi:hypothetical protein
VHVDDFMVREGSDILEAYIVITLQGVLANSNLVAVKQLHVNSQQGMGKFLNEVALITGISIEIS